MATNPILHAEIRRKRENLLLSLNRFSVFNINKNFAPTYFPYYKWTSLIFDLRSMLII